MIEGVEVIQSGSRYDFEKICRICGGSIEDMETEDGNIIRICVCCECPYDCKEKEDGYNANKQKIV